MSISSVTWHGAAIDDAELLKDLPPELVDILNHTNGFIVHHGAFRLRGAIRAPDWHSLRSAWRGVHGFCTLYDSVLPTDVPFGQDQLGDQFLLRDDKIVRLSAETGAIRAIASSVASFFDRLKDDIVGFLNVGLQYAIQPGELLFAYPPFCCQESGSGSLLKPLPAEQVILFHADLARQIKDVPDGARIVFRVEGG
jgi:hypothetical protein